MQDTHMHTHLLALVEYALKNEQSHTHTHTHGPQNIHINPPCAPPLNALTEPVSVCVQGLPSQWP